MCEVTQQFDYLFDDCINNAMNLDEIHHMCLEHLRNTDLKKEFKDRNFDKSGKFIKHRPEPKRKRWCIYLAISSLFLLSLIFSALCLIYGVEDVATEIESMRCILEHNEISLELTRPLFNCSICKDISTVPVERNISRERFEKLYAYTNIPVVVKSTPYLQESWTDAQKTFTFEFLRSLYQNTEGALEMIEKDCQFFPYNTNFRNLADVFNISQEMSEMKEGKWYVGWSNCVPAIETEFRKYYKRPYFLPSDSDSSHLDWIFMGGWGYGAPMHIDNVERPSWQAQLSGKKTWILTPSVECEAQCHTLQVTMETGDIIILDTNKWFHSTYIHPGEISITIGSEYD